MVKKVVTKKISAEVKRADEAVEAKSEATSSNLAEPTKRRRCMFCQSKTNPSYTDIATLRRFLTDRGRITPKLKSGLCSKHQRVVTKHIKYARHLALLPFTPKV